MDFGPAITAMDEPPGEVASRAARVMSRRWALPPPATRRGTEPAGAVHVVFDPDANAHPFSQSSPPKKVASPSTSTASSSRSPAHVYKTSPFWSAFPSVRSGRAFDPSPSTSSPSFAETNNPQLSATVSFASDGIQDVSR